MLLKELFNIKESILLSELILDLDDHIGCSPADRIEARLKLWNFLVCRPGCQISE